MDGDGPVPDVDSSQDRTDPASGPDDAGTGAAGTSSEPTGTAPRIVPEADVFTFSAIQQGGGSRQLQWASTHLRLVFDARGIEFIGEGPSEYSFMPWASVTRVSRGASRAEPGGGSVTVIGIDSPGRIMRFAVTSNHRDPIELTALSERVARWSTSAGWPTEGPGGPVPPAATPGAPTEPDPEQHSEQDSEQDSEQPPDAGSDPDGTDPVPGLPASGVVDEYPPGGRPPGRTLPDGEPPAALMDAPAGSPSSGPPPWPPGPFGLMPPRRRWRTRRIATLVLALVFLGSGIGLAIALSGSGGSPTSAPSTTSPPTPDQALAEQLMLTQNDLPAGWSMSTDSPGSGVAPRIQTGESKITRTFAGCMRISDSEASLVLGGGAADQTAQTSSPVFLGPPSPGQPGFALELQTAATVVRSHQDEQEDFTLLADPRYPQCAGAAVASETQLGADSSSGRNERPGTPSVAVLGLPAPQGEQVSALVVAFTVSDRSASVPIEVEIVSLGHDRIEAELQALAVGGQIPSGELSSPLSVFADRVAGGGQSAEA